MAAHLRALGGFRFPVALQASTSLAIALLSVGEVLTFSHQVEARAAPTSELK